VTERVTIDSNILIYAFDRSEPERQKVAQELIWLAQAAGAILTTTALGEFFWVCHRKNLLPPAVARQNLADLALLFEIASFAVDDLLMASIEVAAERFSFWDAVILATAERAGCRICFSEDMRDGAHTGDITVRNPFGPNGLSDAAKEALGV
jgi:predicted nucleic acid-binding protein